MTNKLTMNLQTFADPTRIADVIVPEVFNSYVINRTVDKNALVQSGIVAQNPELTKLAQAGGKIIQMPHWNDLSGESQELSDTDPLTVNKITTGQDQARLQMRGNAWSANDLAGALAGSDPMMAIGNQVADFWIADDQRILLKSAEGIFASAKMKDNVHDISTETGKAANFSGAAFLDAQFKLGDAYNDLTAIGVHSQVYAYMRKLDLIDFIPDSQGKPIAHYQGLQLIIDDGIKPVGDVYTSYLFGKGAFGYANVGAPVPTETDREALAGNDILINRRHFVLHPRGVKWTEAKVVGTTPTYAELTTATNWERVFNPKKIRIVQFKHKINAVDVPPVGPLK
ncbi:coat protein [Dellaglioa algida]|uniref:Coat protein n=1 Tax=Dellaglioa algida TaxID=105612 RepID=A0A5C6M6E6_9LACO|nr:coat protein [Dellaglioa algida]MDK1720220.1 coat protein [Dellaglioa algida]MDK1723610.1 coat protein [Dellaglioa algida]TWW10246.1 coat protein [Dellaglioa algida]